MKDASGSDDTIAAPDGVPIANAAGATGVRQRLGERYELLGLLGAGSMGSVYKARDLQLDEVVALKTLRQELLADQGMLDRFKQEVKLARRVTHRNVARTFDIGEHAGEPFLTMEFVDGESLASWIARNGPPTLTRTVEIAREICHGLSAAHGAGVIHRDLKPENVLLERGGRVVITDFGIARAHRDEGAGRTANALVGTPAYMAPEQVEGGHVDARSDIYALGAVLYELMTGARAWPGDAPIAVAAARLAAPPPDPRLRRGDLPDGHAGLVLRCMARRPENRFSSAAEVEEALLGLAALATRTAPSAGVMHASTSRAPPAGKTVAVLPLKNAGAADDAYLADGLTDDLIDALSNTPGLRVRSRRVVTALGNLERDPRALGAELDVQVVVEGSVERRADAVRIRVRVIGVADGFQLFAKRFDPPESALLAVNDEVASAVAAALAVDLGTTGRRATTDPEAIDLYLRARSEYRQFWAAPQTIELLERALRLAPDDPVILSSYATACVRHAFMADVADGEGAMARGRAAARRAVAIGSHLGDPHLALGTVLFQDGDAVGAVAEAREAIARAPGLAEAHALLGRILGEIGDSERGTRHLEIALDIDPHVILARIDLARVHALRGDWLGATAILDAGVDYGTSWFTRVRFFFWQRDPERARGALAQIRDEMPEYSSVAAAALQFAEGALEHQAPAMVTAFGGSGRGMRRRASYLQLAAEFAGYRNDAEGALEMLEQSIDAELIDLAWLDGCPLLEVVRTSPRFAVARRRVAERVEQIRAALR